MLTHYTGTASAVANILAKGFGYIPNKRNLTNLLIPQHNFSGQEPQDFGMISFTELEPQHAEVHRNKFGSFGIVVSDTWANQNGAQRVIYVADRGPVTDALCALFDVGYADVSARVSGPVDKFWEAAFDNKWAASAIAGSTLWAHLLQLWEFLEPASSAEQREWRISNPKPVYSIAKDKRKAVRDISPPQGWANHLNVLRIGRSDVVALVCRSSDLNGLRSAIPQEFRDVPVVQVSQ